MNPDFCTIAIQNHISQWIGTVVGTLKIHKDTFHLNNMIDH